MNQGLIPKSPHSLLDNHSSVFVSIAINVPFHPILCRWYQVAHSCSRSHADASWSREEEACCDSGVGRCQRGGDQRCWRSQEVPHFDFWGWEARTGQPCWGRGLGNQGQSACQGWSADAHRRASSWKRNFDIFFVHSIFLDSEDSDFTSFDTSCFHSMVWTPRPCPSQNNTWLRLVNLRNRRIPSYYLPTLVTSLPWSLR